ncbi:MAG: hypothetical protein ACXWTY_06760 [Methylobacter sp.]
MKIRKFLGFMALVSILFSGLASAEVTEEGFKVKSTRSLINLCTASLQDTHTKKPFIFVMVI